MRQLRQRRYGSAVNYLTTARRMHVKAKHPWTSALAMAFTDCGRAGKRHLEPARRAKAFRWLKLGELWGGCVRLPRTYLKMPLRALALSSHYLLRRVEVGELNKAQVIIKQEGIIEGKPSRGSVTLTSDKSKMDYAASGVRIRIGCWCPQGTLQNQEVVFFLPRSRGVP